MPTALLTVLLAAAPATDAFIAPAARAEHAAYAMALNTVPDATRLRAYHELFGSEPHMAGTPGDLRMIDRMVDAFEDMGLDVERHDVWVYLSEPVEADLQIISPVALSLPITESVVDADPDSGHPERPFGFNAYAATGDVTGEIVYANFGRKEDFATLREIGVDVRGRIVLARYGGNYRGFKAKFAEEAGAAGLIIYTDPRDSGYAKGLTWPEGGYANDTSIQRGSIKTLPYAGDPLTPFVEATKDAERLDPESLALPRIPVQPVGWRAAQAIMRHMRGRPLPPALIGTWQGGLPLAYRIEGGEELRVRVAIEQERRIVRTSNVVATLQGATHPDDLVVLGCHHDAWGFGASDPLAGLMVLFECARSFAEAAENGHRPRRSVAFAAWGAEEYGIIGSTEWCEANVGRLAANGVAYINLDMAAMGPNFGGSAAPTLKDVIIDAARSVPAARETGRTVYDVWTADGTTDARLGNLGGGSDHVGFYCHAGVPSCGLGGRGGRGTAYHSNYDTLHWYRQVVGEDYAPAVMVTRMANLIALRLADATLLPFAPDRYVSDLRGHVADLRSRAERDFPAGVSPLDDLAARVEQSDRDIAGVLDRLTDALEEGRVGDVAIDRANRILIGMERHWLSPEGLPERPWFRSRYAASDPDSGYASWMLPAVRLGIERKDAAMLEMAVDGCIAALDGLAIDVRALDMMASGR